MVFFLSGTPPPDYNGIMALENGMAVENSNGEARELMAEEDEDADKWMVGKDSKLWQSVQDSTEVRAICSPLQVVSASFAAFSHGGNDVR